MSVGDPPDGAIIEGVQPRVSSPTFVGRQEELGALVAAYDAARSHDQAATVIVGGDAGVGKTRLLRELATRVRADGGLVLWGSCLELVDRALPFAPVAEVLRQVVRELPPATVEAVLGSARGELARMVPDLGPAPGATGEDAATGEMFQALLGVLERLGDRGPTVVVLEDLHWSDAATRDLVVFLAHQLAGVPVLVVGTYRSDDLHRRHPLRSVLAAFDRSGLVSRIELASFGADEVAAQLEGISGERPAPDVVERVYARSEGNALFVEELAAAPEMLEAEHVPPSLRDLVLARVDALSEPAQRVLRLAAVVGRTVPHPLLAAASSMADDELHAALRDAVAARVLETEAGDLDYRFRHALVREAVYDDLLPGERVTLHARVATVLTDRPELLGCCPSDVASELACHWNSANDQPRALAAAIVAAREAEQLLAYGDALAHAERAVGLWGRVPDAEELTGTSRVELLRETARYAHLHGDADRARAFAREALDLVDPERDPMIAGLLYERIARYTWESGRAAEATLADSEAAVRLVPAEPPTRERASVLASYAAQLMLASRNEDAIAASEGAIAVATLVGDRAIESHARNTRGAALTALGRFDDGYGELHAAAELAREADSPLDLARAAVNYSSLLEYTNRHEDSVRVALEGAAEAAERGLERSFAVFLRLNAVVSLYELGRWDEAEEHLREVEALEPTGIEAMRLYEMKAALDAGRGRFDEVEREIAAVRGLLGSDGEPSVEAHLEWTAAESACWSGDPERARAVLRHLLDGCRGRAFGCAGTATGGLVAVDARACADLASEARRRGDEAAARQALDDARQAHERWLSQLETEIRGTDAPTWIAQAEAELARAEGRPDAARWREIAEEWRAGARLPRLAYAQFRAAEAQLEAGGGAVAAAAALREAYDLAAAIGWDPLRVRVERLARRARIEVGADTVLVESPAEAAGLTPREAEVLGLVSLGRTNRQIADELFISAKTASVHVSNILVKLGVANRGEAAARARELGIEPVAAR